MKKGFTLVELLAVIAILGMIVVIAVPNVMDIFKSSNEGMMISQETSVLDAANIYLNDYCIHPIYHSSICSVNRYDDSDSNKVYLCLGNVISTGRIGSVYFKGSTECRGFIVYDKDATEINYSNGKVFLKCGDEYITADKDDASITTDSFNYTCNHPIDCVSSNKGKKLIDLCS